MVFLESPTFTPPLLQGHTPPPMSYAGKEKIEKLINDIFTL